jgi:hypothetical protein
LAKASKPVDDAQDEAVETYAVPVVRDSTFHRATVDNMLIFGVGDDVELACLQTGTDMKELAENYEFVRVTSNISHTEVARLRMSWQTAIRAAMNILRNGIESGMVNRNVVLDRLAKIEPSDESNGD